MRGSREGGAPIPAAARQGCGMRLKQSLPPPVPKDVDWVVEGKTLKGKVSDGKGLFIPKLLQLT